MQTFFRIDVENNGVIKQSECDLFLSFVRLDMSPSRRQKVFAQADLTGDGESGPLVLIAADGR